jgi:hypothetical protein
LVVRSVFESVREYPGRSQCRQQLSAPHCRSAPHRHWRPGVRPSSTTRYHIRCTMLRFPALTRIPAHAVLCNPTNGHQIVCDHHYTSAELNVKNVLGRWRLTPRVNVSRWIPLLCQIASHGRHTWLSFDPAGGALPLRGPNPSFFKVTTVSQRDTEVFIVWLGCSTISWLCGVRPPPGPLQ